MQLRPPPLQPRERLAKRIVDPRALWILKNPALFAWRTLKAFKANQGLLLAGAVAYYALLSIVPLLFLSVIVLSHFVDRGELLQTIGRHLEWAVPSQSKALVHELGNFLEHSDVVGWVLLATMLFFSSLAFTVLESAMSVIFLHRVALKKRRYLVSALLPYCYIVVLAVGLLVVTVVSSGLQAIGLESVVLLGHRWSLGGVSGALLYLLGFSGEVLLLTSLYMTMPVGRLKLRHSLIGGLTAAVLWEITRHILVWYFATLSQVNLVYGSLTTAIVVMLSLEIAATFLLLGAQVISEFERIEHGDNAPPEPFHT